jgi:acetylornithine deacetylase
MPTRLTTLDMIKALIETPSVSSALPELDMSNRPVVDLLAGWLEDEGFTVEIQPLPQQPDKANLIAVKGNLQTPGGLVLSGHTDTVPCDPALWRHDPFKLYEDGNKLMGLGSADMKSFFALAITAARAFDAGGFQRPLILLATADEETSMQGAQVLSASSAFMPSTTQPHRAAMIGEPTALKPIRMHKGVMMERISVHGRSGHSSNPALGHNALEGMQKVLADLLAFRADLQRQYQSSLFEVPVPTLNLGHIHGGDNPNRICGDCLLDIDIRPLPGMDLDELRARLRTRLENLFAGSPLRIEFTTLFDGLPPMETPAGAEVVKVVERLTGHTAGAIAFGTEAPYLQRLGLDVVVLGPGSIDVAHQPDEYLDRGQIQPTIDLLEKLIHSQCVGL